MTIIDRINQALAQINKQAYPSPIEDYEVGFNEGLYEASRYLELILELSEED